MPGYPPVNVVDANGAILNPATPVIAAGSALIGKVDHATTGIVSNTKVVTTAGTAVKLVASTTPAKWVIVQSQTDNTSSIAVGDSTVLATVATGNGILLGPGESVTLPVDDLVDVWIDALVNGEGVRFIYGT